MTGIFLSLLSLLPTAAPEIRVVNGPEGKPVAVEAVGLDRATLALMAKDDAKADDVKADDAKAVMPLNVYVLDEKGGRQLPAVLGRYSVEGETLRFTPRYALRPGLTYLAELFPPPKEAQESPSRLEKKFTIAAAKRGEPTRLTTVYPSAGTLPENQLRFYLHFSAPMSRGEAYRHIRLLKADGEPVDLPFLEIGEELWDPTGKRLTLLIDPGRIKRGLKPREENGPVLEAGKQYTLVVAKGWRDAAGHPLAKEFAKTFDVGSPVETALDPKGWMVHSVKHGSHDPLIVKFDRPLDHALLERTLTVVAPGGEPARGKVSIEANEREWRFTPDDPWPAGQGEIVIETTLEDGAGNRIGRPFEVDELTPIEKRVVTETVRLPFKTRR